MDADEKARCVTAAIFAACPLAVEQVWVASNGGACIVWAGTPTAEEMRLVAEARPKPTPPSTGVMLGERLWRPSTRCGAETLGNG